MNYYNVFYMRLPMKTIGSFSWFKMQHKQAVMCTRSVHITPLLLKLHLFASKFSSGCWW